MCSDKYWWCNHFRIKGKTGICDQKYLGHCSCLGKPVRFLFVLTVRMLWGTMALWKAFGIIQRIIAIFNYNMTSLSLCLVIFCTWWQSLEKTLAASSHSCAIFLLSNSHESRGYCVILVSSLFLWGWGAEIHWLWILKGWEKKSYLDNTPYLDNWMLMLLRLKKILELTL